MPEMQEPQRPILAALAGELWGVVKIFIVALAIVLPLRYYIAQPFIVRGASMEPNFKDRDYLVIDEITYALRLPKRGEPIILRYPKDPQEFFIKRIIGLPGETVQLKDGEVKIKNKVSPESFALKQPYLDPPDHPTYPEMEITLRPDEYFVLGDNRDFSSDSRVWGPVPKNLIVGRALFRAWPAHNFGMILNYSTEY